MQTRVPHPYTTPLAAPPPPLNLLSSNQGRGNANLPAFAGARHTLGPTFSEEEDGDDSQFIAEKMAVLGLNRLDVSRGTRRQQDGERRAYTPPAQGSRRTRKRAFEASRFHTSNQTGGRDQNTSPAIPHGHVQNHHWDQHQLAQQEVAGQMQHQQAFVNLQHQAQVALLAAQIHHQHRDDITKKQDHYNQANLQHNQQYMSLLQQHQQQQQQRLFALLEQSPPGQHYPSPSGQREQLAAQVQANYLARSTRQKNLDDAETRARFESIPNTSPSTSLRSPYGVENTARASPFARSDSMWSATSTAPKTENTTSFGQFSRPQNTVPQSQLPKPSQGTALSALLSRRAQAPIVSELGEKPTINVELKSVDTSRVPSTTTTAQVSPVSTTSAKVDEEETKRMPEPATKPSALGLGRPKTHVSNLSLNRPVRAWSTPSAPTTTAATVPTPTPRSVSQPATVMHPVRQPVGPPGNMERLKEENFKSLLRKRAGLKLGMLNRRVSPALPNATLEEE